MTTKKLTPRKGKPAVHEFSNGHRHFETTHGLKETRTRSSSLSYRTTLSSVARLAVPVLADWCAVDVLEEDGSAERLTVCTRTRRKSPWL